MAKPWPKILGIVGCIVLLASFVALGQANSRFDAIPDDDTKALLEKVAGEMAVQNHGEVPETASVVLSTRQKSQDVVSGGNRVSSDQPVYLVQMEGRFTVEGPIPAGVEPPSGSTLWFLLDAETKQRLDWGVGLKPEDLSVLGEVSAISPVTPPSET